MVRMGLRSCTSPGTRDGVTIPRVPHDGCSFFSQGVRRVVNREGEA
ncbi:MAG: hypothetical protein AVDCRST_MAG18-3480 [uncultured Thermomicrobiales bacterium]|uniref:Uncharacterized protein n=1 Tax=uncultured Thermomicrobiales bacterium TaxID=1645740 RepID=A0A6J4VMW4_9BACT|nr:MAG: hypothetical protein AVDCRST_MAG18-3480 [uncultured Thermomicrobiales bacterium]